MTFEVRLLGDVVVLMNEQPLEMGGPRQRSVLALLALQHNRSISAEALADRLWPDDQPLSAIKTVQVYVSRIRQTLGPEADRLVTTASGYRLGLTDDELDAARFERGLRQAREALANGSLVEARATLEGALAHWSGPALGDLADEQFARRESNRLEELRLQATEELLELRIAEGDSRGTIGDLRSLADAQPGRERLWRLLMVALYADGRQGEALLAYQEARRYLVDELGIDPSPELQELERAILTQNLPRAQPANVVPAGSSDEATVLVRRGRHVVTVLRVDVARSVVARTDPEILEARDVAASDLVRRAIERHGGTLDRTDKDGATGVFGLMVAREDDALRAVRAAFELTGANETGGDGPVVLRVGIATGEVVAGPPTADGSRLFGEPIDSATVLAGRATPGAVLLANDSAELLRSAVTVEQVPPESGSSTSFVVRALTLKGDEIIDRRTATPFVGRAAELAHLLDAFEHVVSTETPGLATVIGAPGIGKSRLVAEALARIDQRARILRSRCLPYGDGITWWPVRELVLAATGIDPDGTTEEALDQLRAAFGGSSGAELAANRIAAVIGVLEGDAGSPEEMPWAVRRLFERLAVDEPLVVLIDDLQWAEPGLVDLLDHILELSRGQILLVTIARPELEDSRADWVARSDTSIRLDALEANDADELLSKLAPDMPEGALRSRVLSTAEGNPLFMEQVAAYLLDRADLSEVGPDLPIPPTIAALLAARLDQLPDHERLVLERAAVIGRSFWSGALTELLPVTAASELPRSLARLARRGLIRPERSEFVDDEAYRFRHLLIRDAAYAGLLKRDRAELHERFAGWLEGRGTARPGPYDLIIGYHLEQAYRYRTELGDEGSDVRLLADRALAYITPAGQAGEERGDTHATISLLRRALDLAPPPRQRIELLISLWATLQAAGEIEASDAVDVELSALLQRHPDEGLRHRLWLTQAMYNANLQSRRPADDAYAYYESVNDRLGMIHALEVAVVHPDPYISAVERLDRAVELAFEIGRPDRASWISARSAWIFPGGPIPVTEGLTRLRQYLEWAGTNGFARAMILMHLGELEAMDDRGAPWRQRFDEVKALIDELGLHFPLGVFGYPAFLASAESIAGDRARIVDLLTESCAALDRRGDEGRLASVAPDTALALLAAGRLDEVERYALWGRDIATADDLDAHGRWRIALSGLRSIEERHGEAVELAGEAVDVLAASDLVVLLQEATMALASALRRAGDEPAALAAARRGGQLAAAKGNRAALRKVDTFLGVSG